MVISVNQKNHDIIEINELWKRYLQDSNPDSLYNNPYWKQEDKCKYNSYDLLRSEGGLNIYSLGKIADLGNVVLSILPIDAYRYDIKSMYYWRNTDTPYVLAITHVLAEKGDDGNFYLTNWLNYYSKEWKCYLTGDITFHYQVYKKDVTKIRKSVEYLHLLKEVFNLGNISLDVYISTGWRESQSLKGYDYTISDIAVADFSNLGGTTDIDNNIIYSNSTKGEFYQHEMMRLLRSEYPDAQRLLWNGLSEYFSEDQMMRGIAIQDYYNDLDHFLIDHPEVDLQYLDSFDSGNLTEKNYLIGMLILQIIEERCGKSMIKQALKTIHTDADLIEFIVAELGIAEQDIDTVFRGYIHSFAENGFPLHKLSNEYK